MYQYEEENLNEILSEHGFEIEAPYDDDHFTPRSSTMYHVNEKKKPGRPKSKKSIAEETRQKRKYSPRRTAKKPKLSEEEMIAQYLKTNKVTVIN